MSTIINPRKLGILWTSRVFSGPDSRDFLHRITTLDVKHLQPGAASSWGFILSPVGKIRSAFHLTCLGPESFLFEYDSGPEGFWGRALQDAIEQFTFSERQALGSEQVECRWLFGESPIRPEIQVIDHGDRDFGRRWWSLWGNESQLNSLVPEQGGLSSESLREELQGWRIEALRPWYSVEVTQDVMPLELGLLDGITQGKGCYPGQEVIERIITQGAPPRRLARIRTASGALELALVKKNETAKGTQVRLLSPNGKAIEGQVEKCVEFDSI